MKLDDPILQNHTIMELFKQAPYFICIIRGPEYVFELANEKYYQLIGRKEIIGKKVAEVLPEVVEQGLTKLLDKIYATGEPYHGTETKIVLRSAQTNKLEEHYVNFIYQPLKDENGKVTGIFVHGVEVTDSVIARQKATSNEARLRKFVDSNIVGIIFWDINGQIIDANDKFLQTIGYTRKDLQKGLIDWRAMTPPEYLELDKTAVEELYKHGSHTPVQKEYIKKDGTRVNVLVGSTFLDNTNKDGIGFVLDISNEVTARKNAQESQEQFRDLSDSMPQLVWTATPEGKVDYYNKKYKEFAGITKKGDKFEWTPVVHEDDRQKTMEVWSLSLERGEIYEIEHRIKQKNGQYQWFLSRGIPVRDKNGTICKWYGTATNIHELKKLEEKKDEFIAVASHELKTPVTSLKAYQQLLVKHCTECKDDINSILLNKMDKQINKINILINDLLDVTKIQAGKLQLRNTNFDIQEAVQDIVSTMQMTTANHKIECQNLQSIQVNADKDRIAQVLENYITNAIKYSPKANKIIVRMEKTKSDVTISVEDFGVGIPEEKTKKIFERFYQVEQHDRKAYAGLGLGLFISKEIINRHKGEVWVTSKVGKGSCFYFSLPL
jgi:PAS domain S-box-containing protein